MRNESIETTLGADGGKKTFGSLKELEEWLNNERSFWGWLESQPITSSKNALRNNWFNEFYATVTSLINQTKNANISDSAFDLCLKNINDKFYQFYSERLGVYSGTPWAKFIEQLRKDEGDGIAAAACAFRTRRGLNFNEYEHLRGAMMCVLFDSGMKDRKLSEEQALQQLRLEWEGKFQTFRENLQNETETHKRLNSDGEKLLQRQDTAYNELIANSKSEWKDLKKTYDDSLALRSPVTYWTKKAKSHFWLSWAYAAVSVGAASAAMYVLIPEVKSMMEVPKGIQDPDKWHPEYWRLAVLIASALFCVWVVRILVRLFLSNVHLLTDARERVTMVQTYLALMRRDKLKDDERMFILQTLFRPTPTGIVKDDAVPLTVIEGITKLRS